MNPNMSSRMGSRTNQHLVSTPEATSTGMPYPIISFDGFSNALGLSSLDYGPSGAHHTFSSTSTTTAMYPGAALVGPVSPGLLDIHATSPRLNHPVPEQSNNDSSVLAQAATAAAATTDLATMVDSMAKEIQGMKKGMENMKEELMATKEELKAMKKEMEAMKAAQNANDLEKQPIQLKHPKPEPEVTEMKVDRIKEREQTDAVPVEMVAAVVPETQTACPLNTVLDPEDKEYLKACEEYLGEWHSEIEGMPSAEELPFKSHPTASTTCSVDNQTVPRLESKILAERRKKDDFRKWQARLDEMADARMAEMAPAENLLFKQQAGASLTGRAVNIDEAAKEHDYRFFMAYHEDKFRMW